MDNKPSARRDHHSELPAGAGPRPLSDMERAELFGRLAKAADARFDRLLGIAWKVRLSAWGALGAATGFVLGAEKWRPTARDVGIGTGLVVGLMLVMILMWSLHSFRRATQLLRVARFWEEQVEHLVGVRPQPELRDLSAARSNLLGVYLSSAIITVIFGCLLITALWDKWHKSSAGQA